MGRSGQIQEADRALYPTMVVLPEAKPPRLHPDDRNRVHDDAGRRSRAAGLGALLHSEKSVRDVPDRGIQSPCGWCP